MNILTNSTAGGPLIMATKGEGKAGPQLVAARL